MLSVHLKCFSFYFSKYHERYTWNTGFHVPFLFRPVVKTTFTDDTIQSSDFHASETSRSQIQTGSGDHAITRSAKGFEKGVFFRIRKDSDSANKTQPAEFNDTNAKKISLNDKLAFPVAQLSSKAGWKVFQGTNECRLKERRFWAAFTVTMTSALRL